MRNLPIAALDIYHVTIPRESIVFGNRDAIDEGILILTQLTSTIAMYLGIHQIAKS